jgi:hypothetical protein
MRGLTWERCSLRTDLNKTFYESFTTEDRARIIETTISTGDNSEFGTDGGNDTTDRIFLLDIQQAERYFDSDNTRMTKNLEGEISWWWLRSTGSVNYYVAYVTMSGKIDTAGVDVAHPNGNVRPAMWLDLTD